MKKLLLFIAAILIAGCSPSKREVHGDVFIVTNGGASVKLGLVQVIVLTEDVAQKHISGVKEKIKDEIAVAKTKIADAEKKYKNAKTAYENSSKRHDREWEKGNYTFSDNSYDLAVATDEANAQYKLELELFNKRWGSGSFFFENLPTALLATQTDADGKFILKLEEGKKYSIIAKSRRQLLNSTEEYYWFINYIAKGNKEKIILSNNNMVDTYSIDNAISPTDLPKLD